MAEGKLSISSHFVKIEYYARPTFQFEQLEDATAILDDLGDLIKELESQAEIASSKRGQPRINKISSCMTVKCSYW